jgi:hypothetical protein
MITQSDDSIWLWDLASPNPSAAGLRLENRRNSGIAVGAAGRWLATMRTGHVELWPLDPGEIEALARRRAPASPALSDLEAATRGAGDCIPCPDPGRKR